MYITQIETCNLQSHEGFIRIDLKEKGLTRFQGDNNDGKSVIPKSSFAMISVSVKNAKKRKALINYNAGYAHLKYSRSDGASLKMHIELESSKCYYELIRPSGEVVRRTFVQGGIHELIEEFGFHYDKERDFSLNIYQTYDPLLLINTSPVTSYDIIQYAITDQNATAAVENLQQIRDELAVARKTAAQNLDFSNRELASLEFFDLEVETARLQKLVQITKDLKALKVIPSIPKFGRIPDISDLLLLDKAENVNSLIESVEILPNHDLNDLEILFSIKKLQNPIDDMKVICEHREALEKNVCPMCERNYA